MVKERRKERQIRSFFNGSGYLEYGGDATVQGKEWGGKDMISAKRHVARQRQVCEYEIRFVQLLTFIKIITVRTTSTVAVLFSR